MRNIINLKTYRYEVEIIIVAFVLISKFAIQENNNEVYNKTVDKIFNVYPNPVNNNLYIEYYTQTKKPVLNIYDMQGKNIKSFNLNKQLGLKNIDVSKIANGVYYISINKLDNNAKRIIVKH